jgi:hypothetical protein
MIGKILSIDYKTAVDFLLPKHYSGRIPNIKWAFGWYIDDILVAVCTFGKPVSPYLCTGICGKENSEYVYELNRLCRTEDFDKPLSQFVGACLRRLRAFNVIVVSYSDTAMNHHGYIYQACNFIYTGITKARTDKYVEGNKHHRHYNNDNQKGLRTVRSSKYRYVFFCTFNKKLKASWKESFSYPVFPYPKGDNENYTLGEYLQQVVIKDRRLE